MEKQISFELVRPVKLIPMNGNTVVNIETSGSFKMVTGSAKRPRKRDDMLLEVGSARLYQTPNGERRKVLINLPTDETDCQTVMSEVINLFNHIG